MPKKEWLRALRKYKAGGYRLAAVKPSTDEATQFEVLTSAFIRSRNFKKAWESATTAVRQQFIKFILEHPSTSRPNIPKDGGWNKFVRTLDDD